MCGNSSGNCCCCPEPQIFQEKICGKLTGPLTSYVAWEVPTAGGANDYFQGTFEIFNAGSPGTGNITAEIRDMNGTLVGSLTVPPGNSVSVSVNAPDFFNILSVPNGVHGKFCITLYKRLFG